MSHILTIAQIKSFDGLFRGTYFFMTLRIVWNLVPFFLLTIWAVAPPRGVPTLVLVPSLPHQPLADPPWCLVQLWCPRTKSVQVLVYCAALWSPQCGVHWCTVVLCGVYWCTVVLCGVHPSSARFVTWELVWGAWVRYALSRFRPYFSLRKNNSIHSTHISLCPRILHALLTWVRKDPRKTDWVAWINVKIFMGAIKVLHRVRPHVGFGRARMIAGPSRGPLARSHPHSQQRDKLCTRTESWKVKPFSGAYSLTTSVIGLPVKYSSQFMKFVHIVCTFSTTLSLWNIESDWS